MAISLPNIDIDKLLADADAALSFAEALAPLGGPTAVGAVTIAKEVVSALETLRSDLDLEQAVLAVKTQAALDALKPRLDAMEADRQRMLDEA